MSLITPERVWQLQEALQAKAKREPACRFHSLYDKLYRKDVLRHAWRCCRANGGAPGVDGVTFQQIEQGGVNGWLEELAKELQGKKGVYEVELVEVKEKSLPVLDDELAKKFGAEDLEKLKAGVRVDLENELKYSRSKALRGQVVRELLNKVNFDLPESAVANETRNVVYDLVRQNTQRGIGRELIEKQKDEIYNAAATSAKERVKLAFLVQRIAEQEKIQASQEDVLKRAQQLAMMYQMPFDQFIKDLQKRNGVNELYEQVLHEKVLELLEKNATITETAPAK